MEPKYWQVGDILELIVDGRSNPKGAQLEITHAGGPPQTLFLVKNKDGRVSRIGESNLCKFKFVRRPVPATSGIDLSKAEIGSKWKRRDGQMRRLIEKRPNFVVLEKDGGSAEYAYLFNGRPHGCSEDCDQDIIAPWTESAPAPKIEQAPICACCTAHHRATGPEQDSGDVIEHDDPCQFHHDERTMRPLVKAMFRESMKRRADESKARVKREDDAMKLCGAENSIRAFNDAGRELPKTWQEKYQLRLKGECND